MTATLTFYGGNTIQGLWIPIYEDTLAERDETVLLTLSNPTAVPSLDHPREDSPRSRGQEQNAVRGE